MSFSAVSVILQVPEHSSQLRRALEGLGSQTFRDFELILVSRGDIGETLRTLASVPSLWDIPKSTVELSSNSSRAEAVNAGAEIARAPLRTWISPNDVMLMAWLEVLTNALRDAPLCGAAYSAYTQFGKVKTKVFGTPYRPYNLVNSSFCFFGPSFLIRTKVWQRAGDHQGFAHDYGHWLRVEEVCEAAAFEIKYTPAILCDQYPGALPRNESRRYRSDTCRWRKEAEKRRAIRGDS